FEETFEDQLKEFDNSSNLLKNNLLDLSKLQNANNPILETTIEIFVNILVHIFDNKEFFKTLLKDQDNNILTIGEHQDVTKKQERTAIILKYWASQNDFFRKLLSIEFSFSFDFTEKESTTITDENGNIIKIPSSIGCENNVLIIGSTKVGKSFFMCASKYCNVLDIIERESIKEKESGSLKDLYENYFLISFEN
ncbi:hypothetical protein MHK_000665, partial [Candidatus Magnetomorum sp. HK-1]